MPIVVDNDGWFTRLTTDKSAYMVYDEITFVAESNYGNSIELVHNMRSIAKKTGRKVEFKIPGQLLGRGPVQLEAVALSESGKGVASIPIQLNIEGRLFDSQRQAASQRLRQQKAFALHFGITQAPVTTEICCENVNGGCPLRPTKSAIALEIDFLCQSGCPVSLILRKLASGV